MDKGEEGKGDSLWNEGITAQSNPLIIPREGMLAALPPDWMRTTFSARSRKSKTAKLVLGIYYVMHFGIFMLDSWLLC